MYVSLEERIGAYRHGLKLTLIDQNKGLAEWRQSDPEAASVPVNLQRGTLMRLDEAYKAFFRRVKLKASKAGFPRFRGRGWWDSFGFREFSGISCTFRRDAKGWKVGFAVDIPVEPTRHGERSVGIDLGISTFAALSDGGFIPSLRAARRGQRRLRVAERALARKLRNSNCRNKARTHLQGLANSILARDVRDASCERWHDCPHCGLSIDRDLNAARNIPGRAGVGPCLPNVAECGKRAGGNLNLAEDLLYGSWRTN